MLGEHTQRITPTLLTQAGEAEGFQHSNPDFWGLQGPVPLLPYFASYCIRPFGFPTSYFSDVTRNICTHGSHDKGASWWGRGEHSQIAGNVLRQRTGPFQQRRRAGGTDRATGRAPRRGRAPSGCSTTSASAVRGRRKEVREQCLSTPAPRWALPPAAQGRARRGHGLLSWLGPPPPGRTPTAPHARATEHKTCSGRRIHAGGAPGEGG